MKAGLAVVATAGVGSALEFVKTGESGIIVQNDSPEALADALVPLVNANDLRIHLVEGAIEAIAHWPVEQGIFEVLEAAKRAGA